MRPVCNANRTELMRLVKALLKKPMPVCCLDRGQ